MTGGGFRTFTAGEVLTAARVQDFFMDQAVMNFNGTAARGSALPSPSAGMVTHIGGGTVQVYNGTAWVALGGVPNAVLSNTPSGTYTSGGTAFAWYEFTASGTATVTTAGLADVLAVGGGGAGGKFALNQGGYGHGGGGAGGYQEVNSLYLAAGSYTVTVGAGAAHSTRIGSASSLGSLVESAGGGSAGCPGPIDGIGIGMNGGSGGGGRNGSGGNNAGGLGITGQGNNGGNGNGTDTVTDGGGGGGGAGAAGSNGTAGAGGNGGNGLASSITGTSVTRAGGGGGGLGTLGGGGTGGTGGGGNGGNNSGTANTGGGGGGAQNNGTPGSGGSGVVIIRVRT
jgi:hypothetical protein